MNHAITASLLLLAFLVSGCTNIIPTQNVAFGDGVVILQFEPELSSVYSGEEANLMLKLQNTGSFVVPGKDDLNSVAQVTLSLGDSEWGCFTTSIDGDDFRGLLPPSQERGTEGEEFVVTWRCIAPQIDEGMKVPYTAYAEAEYSYRTQVSKSITLLPTSELVALRDSGQALPSDTISKSNSPVSVDIQVDGPIRIRDDSGEVDFPVNINIENTGGGIVKDSKVKLEVIGYGGISNVDDCNRDSLDLWKGTSQSMTCRLKAENVDSITQSRIEVRLDYVYITSKMTTIEVIGTQNSGYPL